MTEQERRNTILREFAGFREKSVRLPGSGKDTLWWYDPLGRSTNFNHPPNFYDPEWGIGHWFKWIAPKLTGKQYGFAIGRMVASRGREAEALADVTVKMLEER